MEDPNRDRPHSFQQPFQTPPGSPTSGSDPRHDEGNTPAETSDAPPAERYAETYVHEDEVYGSDADEKDFEESRTSRRERPRPATTALIRQLLDDFAVLARKELALAGSELAHSVQRARRGASGVISGSAILYAGILFLLQAAVLGLAFLVPLWASAFIVGGVVTVIGSIVTLASRRNLDPHAFGLPRTSESLRKDNEVIRRRYS